MGIKVPSNAPPQQGKPHNASKSTITCSSSDPVGKNPDTIIVSGMDEARPDWLDEWKQWSFLKASRYDNLFFIDPDIIQRYTTRILLGTRQLCELLERARKNIRQTGAGGSLD